MLFVTHDLGVARKIGDRIGVMLAGRVVEIGPTAQVLGSPAHPYTSLLVASAKGRLAESYTGNGGSKPKGCPFVSRCDRVQERCSIVFPEPVSLDEGRHLVWCHFPLR